MSKSIVLRSPWGKVTVCRDKHGIPIVEAETRPALFYGQGWVQARDRQIQTMLLKAVFSGRMAELLKPTEDFVGIDVYMRRYGFARDAEREREKMTEASRTCLDAHAAGINAWFAKRKPVWELRLAGWRHEDWSWKDTLAIGRGFGFIGLGDGQGVLEKWLTELLAHGTPMARLKELFPSLCDPDFSEAYKKIALENPLIPESVHWLREAPVFRASNNWVLGPSRSATGSALAAGDPHLDVDRMPAIWQEIVLKQGDLVFSGVGLPGVPGGLLGRTKEVSWSPTYTYMDSIDFRIEEVRGGRYRRADGWKDFQVRVETVRLKDGASKELRFYENENGVLQGDAAKDGFYLIENYAAAKDCGAGDFEAIFGLLDAKTAEEGMACFRKMQAASFNWLLADRRGNIGYQMSGRHFLRPEGTSGLLPLPAWESQYAYRGIVEGTHLPRAFNPPEGYIVSANDDRNPWGTTKPCAVNMGTYRFDRISALLKSRERWTAAELGAIQNDLFSPQADAYLKRFAALIPDSEGGRILKDWDRRYDAASRGAVLFERFRGALLLNTFGKLVWGTEVIERLRGNSSIFNAYFQYFDNLLLSGNGQWFSREQLDAAAVEAFRSALAKPFPRLDRVRRVRMRHVLFGGIFPSFLGFDGGPAFFPGSQATICQGQFYTAGGRAASFGPSFRFLTDLGSESLLTALPGGATDRRFGRYYRNELGRYLRGEYKMLRFDR